MSDSMFGSLLNMLDKHTVGEVANALGQPQTSVARGMESSIAAMLGGMASKSEDTGALRKILDMVPSTSGAISWSQIASGVADPNSSLMATGKRLLPALFGSGEKAVTSGISRESGLPSGAIATLLSMAAPVVMSFISKQVRDGGMTMSSLGAALQRESATIKSALPAGLSDLFWPATATVGYYGFSGCRPGGAKGNVLQLASGPRHRRLGTGPSLVPRPRTPAVDRPGGPVDCGRDGQPPRESRLPRRSCTVSGERESTGERSRGPPAGFRAESRCQTRRPPGSVWTRLHSIQDRPRSGLNRKRNSITLRQFLRIVPSVHLDIAGFTDNVGSAESNLRLSQNRANSRGSSTGQQGCSRDRLTAEGYGEEDPIADNSIEQGRAQNRRAAMRVATTVSA